MNGQGESSEDPRPERLRPQAMPKAEPIVIEPKVREQALPEKDDDRFFDRWAVDKARELGANAVKRSGLERLRDAVRGFATWRSLRHVPAAERESLSDRALVESTPERIRKAEAEAQLLNKTASEAESRFERCNHDVEEAEKGRVALPPPLRGSPGWDFNMLALSNGVVFLVDLFVINIALQTIPGETLEFWITAGTMGAGAVVVGDVLGWMAAAGSVGRDGSLHRPKGPTIATIAALLILAVWFFIELGEFREVGLEGKEEEFGIDLGNPNFFTLAQILFLVTTAVSNFAYLARRKGRELNERADEKRKELSRLEKAAESLRRQAESAERVAAEAPALCRAAEARIASRERVAEGDAEVDLKQGEYLASLIDSEYMAERASAEIGTGYWDMRSDPRPRQVPALRLGILASATLAAGGIAFWVTGNVLGVVLTSLIVAGGLWLAGNRGAEGDEEREWEAKYVAEFSASGEAAEDRVTDIERLVPIVPRPDGSEEAEDGGKSGSKPLTRDEVKRILEALRRYLDED